MRDAGSGCAGPYFLIRTLLHSYGITVKLRKFTSTHSVRALTPFLVMAGVAALGTGCTPSSRTSELPAASTRPRVVGYLASGGVNSKGTRIASLPASDLTHIFYAFANIDSGGRVVLGDARIDPGNFAELERLKARYPHLKLLISVGGWTWSGRFSDAALTAASRATFTTSALDLFIRRWPGLFDGVDIDWEFPVQGGLKGNVERPADKQNFTLLLAELRRGLDDQGKRDSRHYELTIAASARPSEIANIELDRIGP